MRIRTLQLRMQRRESCPESLTAYSFPKRRNSSRQDLRLDTYINHKKLTPPTTPKLTDRWHAKSSVEPTRNVFSHSPHTSMTESSESYSAPTTPASSHYITTRPTDVIIDLEDPSKSRRPSQAFYLHHIPREAHRSDNEEMLDLKEFLMEDEHKSQQSQFDYLRNLQLAHRDH